ncbi:5-dehydro-4-deoxyglucarate dehydratase [Cupriavidus sp. USMAA2-4]|uniref:Probable 5-dehydro-4-deoxyglucarate dehydratase n=1 Tax=Cupriavidus malaysiensis TaxID=367825 RepID=A0ABN4TQ68_9BURK|nr:MULTISPECIES: 5-dehydro-4-deoxyglucarate dehydratase [Cupriavidus]AOY96214.1 5-dehydro-4-deoxyglucarate dehydratase [Cupriavidus sp. USMAA2-4]AOZ03384.1 5-dehydro-4-deoxyglucarate dehydratase [Cupriavidus sp. USMAHM13]AOZ09254.1 5-dehydro-4-deoxyglucarate dehydratase [Cupriavidus malaysiensis]
MTTPQELKQIVSEGLLSFPVTDFDAQGNFRPDTYVERLEWLAPYGATALFAAGGTGEFFSLTPDDYANVIRTAVETCAGKVPILAGAGGPTRTAIAYAKEAQRLGAKGVLLMPHYLTEACEAGIAAHVEEVCKAIDIGVIVYNRANSRLTADMLERLADRCPNLIGFKDGVGEIENMVRIRRRLGDRLSYLGGLPTAEVYAAAYKALGVPVYSSAVFNFIPKTAMDFYRAIAADDHATVGKLLDEFFLPYLEIRNRRAGYAVSIVKAGAKLVGHDAGPVRAPLTDLDAQELEQLDALIRKLGPQ